MCAMMGLATFRYWLGCSIVEAGECLFMRRSKRMSTMVWVPLDAGCRCRVEEPPGPDLEGELLHVGRRGEPQMQVKGRRPFRLCPGVVGGLFGLRVLQILLSPRWGTRGGGRSAGPPTLSVAAGAWAPRAGAPCMIVPRGGFAVGGVRPRVA